MSAQDQGKETVIKRPLLVWVASAVLAILASWSILSSVVIMSGTFPQNAIVRQYYASMSSAEHVLALMSGLLYLMGSLMLFRLSGKVFVVLAAALLADVILKGDMLIVKHQLAVVAALGSAGLVGAIVGLVFGWIPILAVLVYVQKLRQSGVLKSGNW